MPSYRDSGRSTRAARTPAGRKPGGTDWSPHRARRSSPAPARRTSASAISETTSDPRPRRESRSAAEREPARTLAKPPPAACHAGTIPNATLVRERDGEREDRDASVRRHGSPAGAARPEPGAAPGSPRREQETEAAAEERQDRTLGQELGDDPSAGRAERGTDRQLRGPRRDARPLEVGEVGARDRQHEAHGADENRERAPAVPHDVVEKRDAVRLEPLVDSGWLGRGRRNAASRSARAAAFVTPVRRRRTGRRKWTPRSRAARGYPTSSGT